MKFVTTSEQDKENLGKFFSNQANVKELTSTRKKKKKEKKGDLKILMAFLIQCLASMKSCSSKKMTCVSGDANSENQDFKIESVNCKTDSVLDEGKH